MKSLFINQLEALVNTLELANPASFNMSTYCRVKASCGYAACVCGEHAMSGKLDYFPLAKDRAVSINDDMFLSKKAKYVDMTNVLAGYIDQDLRASCLIATGHRGLAQSVSADSLKLRRRGATAGNLTSEQMGHPHLNSKSTSEHAVSYIRMLIEILN
jgi:hypothetical protein